MLVGNGTGIYAVVAFLVPSALAKDKLLNRKSKAGNMHVSPPFAKLLCAVIVFSKIDARQIFAHSLELLF